VALEPDYRREGFERNTIKGNRDSIFIIGNILANEEYAKIFGSVSRVLPAHCAPCQANCALFLHRHSRPARTLT
jgi:hypothetical protein